MPATLDHLLDAAVIRGIARDLHAAHPPLDERAFVRDATRAGPREKLELSSLVESVLDEAAETGADAWLRHAPAMQGNPLADIAAAPCERDAKGACANPQGDQVAARWPGVSHSRGA